MRAEGFFTVELTPLTLSDDEAESVSGRMSIRKEFRGQLKAVSTGQMLTAMTPVRGSAGYVAIERVTGTLEGRSGAFTLQHSGLMTRGAGSLVISVVPDSASGELEGLSGQMTVEIRDGEHSYSLEYTLPGFHDSTDAT